jgi:hypothetical protein
MCFVWGRLIISIILCLEWERIPSSIVLCLVWEGLPFRLGHGEMYIKWPGTILYAFGNITLKGHCL